MQSSFKLKLVTALLLMGTVGLIGGGILAAALVSPDRSAGTSMATGVPNSRSPAQGSIPPGVHVPVEAPVLSEITYTIRAGDRLSDIARWFTRHGYGVLYAANQDALESNRLVSGDRVAIVNGVMTVSRRLRASAAEGA